MSNASYNKWWVVTKKQLEELKAYEEGRRKYTKDTTIKERVKGMRVLGDLYCRYSLIVQELDLCLDQMIQVCMNPFPSGLHI